MLISLNLAENINELRKSCNEKRKCITYREMLQSLMNLTYRMTSIIKAIKFVFTKHHMLIKWTLRD